MFIKRIVLTNFLRYRGVHELLLEPKVYGIGAELDGDRERSNWVGKTSLLEAIDFALHGRHRWPLEDDWITRGESEGGVLLEHDTGLEVERTRRRGKSTQLAVRLGAGKASGDAAQALLTERLGLSKQDFLATSFFMQKQMARFIVAKPSQRMEIVGEWFELDPLERAEDNVRRSLNALATREEQTAQRFEMGRQTFDELLARLGLATVAPDELLATIDRWIETAREARARAKARAAEIEEQRHARTMWDRDVYAAGDHARLLADASAARAELQKVTASSSPAAYERLRKQVDETQHEVRKANDAVKTKRSLAVGTFDGHCPVGEMQCPVTDKLNAQRARGRELAKQAEDDLVAAALAATAAGAALSRIETQRREAQALEGRAQALEEQAARHAEAARRVKAGSPPVVPADESEVVQRLTDAEVRLRDLEQARGTVAKLLVQQQGLAVERVEVGAQVATTREGVLVLKTARRRIAEQALEEINGGANRLLVATGIPLTVRARWERETSTLATACDACGSPFPSSQRVKACERCHTQRGPKLEQKLEVELSDRSGAAEDLAGIAFQLSAGAWLRARRGSAWSVACIDEPFGSLDASNRRALVTHLLTMLRSEYGFTQAFVIAHEGELVDVMPGRIRVIGAGRDSRVVVE